MKKKVLSMVCACMLVMSMMGICGTAYAENTVVYVLKDIQEMSGGEIIEGEKGLPAQTCDKLYNTIYEAAKNKQTDNIDITALNIRYKYISTVEQIILDVIYEHPELYYLRTHYGYGVSTENPGIYDDNDLVVSLRILTIGNTSDKESAEFFSKVDYIIASVVREGMTDEEKALVLHDYIVDNTVYDSSDDIPAESYTSYSVIMDNIGVCQGYSLAYNLLLSRVGIEAKYVSSTAMVHGWSMVKLDEKWYHADLTWDDPTNVEMVSHNYFLLSDEGITNLAHYGWSDRLPKCSDDKYESEDYCFDMVDKLMKYKDGKFYYLDYKQVSLSEIGPGQPYYIINDKYYITEYVRTKFDGSEREKITEQQYNTLDSEGKKAYYPVKSVDGVTTAVTLGNLAGSSVYIKTDSYNPATERIGIAYYDENKSLIGVEELDVSVHTGYVEAVTKAAPSDAVKAKIVYWNRSMNPVSNFVLIDR